MVNMFLFAVFLAGLLASYLGATSYKAYNAWKMGEVHKNPYDYGILGGIALFQNTFKKEKDYSSDLYKKMN